MLRHVILWKIKASYSDEEKENIKKHAKAELEALRGEIPGLEEINVYCDALPTSSADLMLDSMLVSEETLSGYAVHPAHVRVADEYVRPYMEVRMCMDFEV